MARLFFAGGEQPSHRNLLGECGVTRYAINLTNINRLVKPGWDVTTHLPDGALWIAYADKDTTWEMAESYVAQEPYLTLGPLEWREHFEPGAAFAPYWADGVEPNVWPVVGLMDDTVKASVTLRRIMNQFQTSILAAVTGSVRGVERLDVVVSYAWTMAQRYGETHVWAGNKLHRYAGNRKAEARPKHRGDIERLGVDYERIHADDPVETARLAILSWQEWENRYSTPAPTPVASLASNEDFTDQDGNGSSRARLTLLPTRNGHAGPDSAREQSVLPGLRVDEHEHMQIDGDGVEQVSRMQTIAALGQSFRKCNTCYVAANCPAFKPNHECAYNIPVEARTKDQVQAIMQAVVEMQMQRVAFARYGEQLDGQGIDGSLSAEIDRLFTILAKMKDILDDSDTFRFEMTAKAKGGVLSRLFGEGVGAAARALPIPVSSEDVMHTVDP